MADEQHCLILYWRPVEQWRDTFYHGLAECYCHEVEVRLVDVVPVKHDFNPVVFRLSIVIVFGCKFCPRGSLWRWPWNAMARCNQQVADCGCRAKVRFDCRAIAFV